MRPSGLILSLSKGEAAAPEPAMYVPKAFEKSDPAWSHELIRAHPFALLTTVDDDGAPFATHLPLLLDAGRGPFGTLMGHVAKANPQVAHLRAGRITMALFRGPHAYVSPGWYAHHPAVPTWNYVTVHAYGRPVLQTDAAAVRAHLNALSRIFESGQARPWRLGDQPETFIDGMLKGLVAFELPIGRLEGKAKLSQNRKPEDRAGAIAGLRAAGDPEAMEVARLMQEE